MKKRVINVFNECVKAVLPRNVVRNALTFHSGTLRVRGAEFRVPDNGNVYVVGFGKAALGMALEVEELLDGGGTTVKEAVVSVPIGCARPAAMSSGRCRKVRALESAENNTPDERTVANTERIRRTVNGLAADDTLIVLVSGGGSALLCSPTVPLRDKIAATKLLSSSGASIDQLNVVRKALSNVKGGKLIGSVPPSTTIISLILSDVVDDPLAAIASGPTVPDDDDPVDLPAAIVDRYDLRDRMPVSVLNALGNRGRYKSRGGGTAHNYVIGNNTIALRAGAARAAFDYATVVLSSRIRGDVTLVADFYARLAAFVRAVYDADPTTTVHDEQLTAIGRLVDDRLDIGPVAARTVEAASTGRGVCVLAGGEPTVRVLGPGVGGRNQELALRTAIRMHEQRPYNDRRLFDVTFFSGGTDGVDGPTDACGAFGYPGLVTEARARGLEPARFVDRNDSHGFYSAFDGGRELFKVGHTGTNVMDVHVLVVEPKRDVTE